MKTPKIGSIIECPHCKGGKGKIVLLYYWIKCYLCEGTGEMKIDKIVKVDEKHGDIKATFSLNKGQECDWNYSAMLRQKTEWLI